MGIWLGGMAGGHFDNHELEKFPAIKKLGEDFSDFQNSPYRGEWNQKKSITFGDIRDILIEAANLIRNQKGDAP